MPFIARISLPHAPKPAKLYVHEAGYKDTIGDVSYARRHALDVLYDNSDIIKPADFFLVALWGKNGTKITEVCGYDGIDPWPGNPDIRSWVFHNGVYRPEISPKEKDPVACEDTFIAFGDEGMYRRRTRSLEEYIVTYPHLGDLEPPINLDFL